MVGAGDVVDDVLVEVVVALVVEVTEMENGARLAVFVPSLTEMITFEYVPAFAFVGVPVSAPVAMLKLDHIGLLVIE